jgi:transposase-like protein
LWAYENDIRVLNPQISDVLKYLRIYFETGVGYGAVNAARCALSVVLPRIGGQTIGEHFLVRWLCKSCHEQRPPQPRYSAFWSVDKVLTWIKSLGRNSKMSWKLLSLKLTLLLLLVSSQRGQTILALHTDRMNISERSVVFRMKTLLKHNHLGQPLDTLTFYAYPEDPRLCVVRTLVFYTEKTSRVRKNNTQLLLSYIAPHLPISRATLARWTISVLALSGVDTSKYRAHSTRGASASSAWTMGANINAILRNASWRDAKSFAVHYHKTIEDPGAVQRAVLDTANNV